MTTLRTLAGNLLRTGRITPGWYAILTGVAMLWVSVALASVARDDTSAGIVALVLLVTGAWQLQRGLRAELGGRRG